MEIGQSWKVRDGDEKDREGILSLRKIVFGEMEEDKLDPKVWRWQFMEGPDGKAFIYIAEDGGRVIGHFADVPRRFSANGRMVLGTLSLDLMVHPDYRRKGIFSELGRYAAQRVKKEKGLFMTAFPIRKETITGLLKIGWKIVGELPVLVYPISFCGMLDRHVNFLPFSLLVGGITRFFYSLFFHVKRVRSLEGIDIEEVKIFNDSFDRFWEKALSLYPMMGVRDRTFLSWRFLQNPFRRYTIYRSMEREEMTGYLILRKVDLLKFNSAVIVDLLALNNRALIALIQKGIQHSQKVGADLLGCMIPQKHPYHQILKGSGFLPSRKTFLLMVYRQGEKKVSLDPEAWYVNWGDTDVI